MTLVVVVCWTSDRGVAGLSLNEGTLLCPCERHVILCLVLAKPKQRPEMTKQVLTGT